MFQILDYLQNFICTMQTIFTAYKLCTFYIRWEIELF